jgi:hypothetical protein
MKVTGTITKVLPTQSGTSKAGKEWKKLSFLLETDEKYNNLYCFDVFGDEKVDNFEKYNKVGDMVDVEFNVKTNEWNDKYFVGLDAWKIFKADANALTDAAKKIDVAFEPADDLTEVDDDSLPF